MGPLAGIKIIELAGIGPGPMCAMVLADLGATVLRIERAEPVDLGVKRPFRANLIMRNRKQIALDLKKPEAVEAALALIDKADGLIEGFRPGVTERLGLGPEVCLKRNPRLVYGRMTGWGQQGPLAKVAAHDTNYIAITGALNAIGRKGQPPTPPLNLLGDFAGGSLYLAVGMLAAILECRHSGQGQVVDAAIVDGVLSLSAQMYGSYAAGVVTANRGENTTDSGAHFFDCYECKDGKFISVAAVEKRFYLELCKLIGVEPDSIGEHTDPANWDKGKEIFAATFLTRSRDEWTALLEGTDSCFAPVLDWGEAPSHPHLMARGSFVEVDGIVQPGPAPRFSRSVPHMPTPPAPVTPENTAAGLAPWLSPAEIAEWRARGLVN
jgi:crotonobetainyl-CoA:carnitine CoA-transferase CaiB-like acyl-CoA transferase